VPVPAQPQTQSAVPAAASQGTQPVGGQLDEKSLQAQSVEQIEAAILQTMSNPSERALLIHNIKAGYIKAKFGVDMKGSE
jgi:hypothetical protein